MKKLLMLVLIGLLLALSAFIVIQGFEVGKVEVLSYTGIQERNQQLDEKIQQASKLAEKDFKQAISTVQDSSKKLEKTKKEYEDLTVVSTDGEIQTATQIERYEIETLWVKLGNYATSEGAVVRIDIVRGNTSNTYNLKFTVNGSYISITDFISDIENDSTLGFKIEEFKMIPSGDSLQGTFICKEIAIKEVSETSNPNMGTTPEQTNTTNTTNTTKSNTTNNSTNTATGNNIGATSTNTKATNTNVAR
ncbi:MAG: hypothetical protein HFJ33_04105 [Clostridia bacterium]|nr:hypothetical protein [Clostridia bacterium]